MCQLCNESLLAAAQAASMLARAAKDLYSINQQAEASTLAKAAAELFVEVKSDTQAGEAPFAAGETASPVKGEPETKVEGVTLPQGFHIDDDGVVFINGLALGRVVVISKPTKH